MATSFEMNLGGMLISVAEELAAGTFAGGTEWRLPVNQMWLQKCGKNGDYNPRLVSADQWKIFQKAWSDIASRKIDVDALVA
jgi:basic membrane protein A